MSYKINDISKLIVLLLFSFTLSAQDCNLDDLLKTLKESLTDRYQKIEFNENAKKHAKKMKSLGLSDVSYMVDWKLKRKNQMGPWAMKGNTFINGIREAEGRQWMKEVGMKSFGLGFEKHPGDVHDTPTAVLRWKNYFFDFSNIQDELVENLDYEFDLSEPFTEVTFMATEAELKAIRDFIEARVRGEIRAKRIVRTSPGIEPYAVGDELRPEFEFDGDNLFFESCANACTSPFNPRWLEHYDTPEALKLATLALEKGIRPEVNAKALVYYNFRNTNASSVTVLGLPDEMTQARFIEENEWSEIGGMMWGFIPDRMPAKPSPNYNDERLPINEWLARNR